MNRSTLWSVGVFLMTSLCFTGIAGAQEKLAEADAAAQANNPLANSKAFNIHNYYIGDYTGLGNENGNQAWVRYATPLKFGDSLWIMRASLPLNTSPLASTLEHETGFGDFNIFAAYLIDMGPGISFGVGPQLTAPTASQASLGSEKWSPGLVNTLFNATSKTFQYGYLISWSQSVAGKDERADVNVGSFQPFAFYQLGNGWHLRSSAVMQMNLENGDYTVPLGLGIGKVTKYKKIVQNIFIEPQVSVADEGDGWSKWQIFVGVNNQF